MIGILRHLLEDQPGCSRYLAIHQPEGARLTLGIGPGGGKYCLKPGLIPARPHFIPQRAILLLEGSRKH